MAMGSNPLEFLVAIYVDRTMQLHVVFILYWQDIHKSLPWRDSFSRLITLQTVTTTRPRRQGNW
jgi:hypothetical protein